jgi:stage II sporulation protein D
MRRVIIAFEVRKGIFIFISIIMFVLLMPIILIGIGNNTSVFRENNPKLNNSFILKNSDISNLKDIKALNIKVYITEEKRIEEIPLEEYIKGVVSAEMPAAFEIEALKAQAIAARTYAISKMKDLGGVGCNIGTGADICDTVHCQAYMKKEDRFKGWKASEAEGYWNKITEAVQSTSGMVLVYEGQLVKNPQYFAVSSGKTEDSAEVFSTGVPYLKSVSSPGEEVAPKYKTTFNFTYAQLSEKINKTYPNAKVSSAKLKNQLIIVDRNEGGSIKNLKVGNATISGQELRSLLDLTSANFSFKFNTNSVDITCLGYGHGVGMSQWGANIMAQKGSKYSDILTHYYQGVNIKKLNEIH